MSFEWQTEEEVDWGDISNQPEKEPEQPRRSKPWGVIVLLVLLLTAVSILIYEVSQRVSSATEQAEDELLASVTVVQNAAADGDRMLFSAFLSGRDKAWADANEMLVTSELFLQRSDFGLDWIEVEPEATVISTTLSPDLRSADVLLEYDYALDVGNGFTDTIALRQTAVYRLGENKWLLAPPESEFWGEEKSMEAGALTVIYPERDEAIVRKLAADWSAAWAGTCALFGDACDRDFQRRVKLSIDPASLKGEAGPLEESAFVQLPTPSLVGLPTDRDGYGALYRGYLVQILRPFWQKFVEKACCGGELLYDAAVEQLWQEISGWPAPVTAVDWQALQQRNITLQEANRLWDIAEPTEENIQLAAAIITFLVEGRDIEPIHILQSLTETEEYTLTEHFIAYFDNTRLAELWERDWQQFVQEQAGVETSLVGLPAQDLLLLCRPDWSNKVALYRHDLQQNTTTLVQDFNYLFNNGFMIGLPGDSGIVMSGQRSDGTADAFLLKENVRYELQPDRETTLRPLMVSNGGDYILWYQFGDPSIDEFVYTILDEAACLEENDCQVQMNDIFPVWSPDGKRMIGTRLPVPFLSGLNVEDLLTLRTGDGDEFLRSLGFGTSPVWLDKERYAFVQTQNDGRPQLFLAQINQETEPELLLGVEDFAQIFPDIDSHVFVDFVFRDPHNANRLYLMMGLGSFDQFDRALLAYDLEADDLEIRWSLNEALRHPGVYQLSPDGQWFITTSALPGDSPLVELHLHSLQSGETITMPMGSLNRWPNLLYADWSEKNDWLSFPRNGMIELFAPETGNKQVVTVENLFCTNAVWVEK